MKVRTDFVTNSSSSSFILGFTDEDSIERELKQGGNMSDDDVGKILANVRAKKRIELDELDDIISTEMYYHVRWDMCRNKKRELLYTCDNESIQQSIDDCENSGQMEIDVRNKLNEIISISKNKAKGDNVIVEVEYRSDTGDNKEELLMSHPCTILSISHH